MKVKKRGLLLFTLLVLLSVGTVSKAYAETASTEVAVQFAPAEEKEKDTKDDRVIPVSVDKDSNGTGYQARDYSRKRLPSTNDQYQLILSQLGYLALFLFLIILIVRKREERAP